MENKQASMEVSVEVQDLYSWRASYSKTEHLDEEHAAGGFASVDLGRCIALTLFYVGVPMHTVHIPSGAIPIFFRRRRIAVNVIEESRETQTTAHCIGWKRGEQDAVYLFVYADGTTLLSSDLQAG